MLDKPFLQGLVELIRQLWTKGHGAIDTYSFKVFYSTKRTFLVFFVFITIFFTLQKLSATRDVKYEYSHHQDSHEYLLYLLGWIHSELIGVNYNNNVIIMMIMTQLKSLNSYCEKLISLTEER